MVTGFIFVKVIYHNFLSSQKGVEPKIGKGN